MLRKTRKERDKLIMKEDAKLLVECMLGVIASTALFVVVLPLLILLLPFLIVESIIQKYKSQKNVLLKDLMI